jgi:predicted ATP-dependent endonuclease of OLD family
MNLNAFSVRNLRRLKDAHIQLDSPTSIFVGANNSGKTSATQVFQLFLGESGEKFAIHDFSADCWREFDAIDFEAIAAGRVVLKLPTITLDLWFDVQETDIYRVIDLLPSLNWTKDSHLGVRIEYAPKDPAELIKNYQEAKGKAPKKAKDKTDGTEDYFPWPKTMTDYLTKRLSDEYEKRYYVLDRAEFDANLVQKLSYVPLQLGDNERSGAKILRSLLRVDFLNAQRHISDVSSPGRSEDLSKRLSKFYDRNLKKRDEIEMFEAIRALAGSEAQLNVHLAKVFTPTLEKLNDLGYPGFFDPHLLIKSALNPETIMKQNAQVYYALGAPGQPAQDVILPDKYNGLGFKNLIYMVIEVLDFHARWTEEKEERAPLHLVIIEEPEAHLHAQLQQVFIRKILAILPEEDASLFSTQLIVTTHSPHIIYESGFTPIRYFRRSNASGAGQTSEVLNLSDFYGKTKKETQRFLQQYMKLTHCDLFFADAVILVEGNVERLLLPLMIGKSAPRLQLSYLSVLEVGGAFAHCFKELIEFLGQTTLVITDLDSVSAKAVDALAKSEASVEDDEDLETVRRAVSCMAGSPDAVTSNNMLKEWLPRLTSVPELLAAKEELKIQKSTDGKRGLIRVCYQTVQKIAWKEEVAELAGRTLEESFALENLEWCQHADQKDLQLKVAPKSKVCSLEEIAEKVFKRVDGGGFKKTEFALGLMTKAPESWNVPAYIHEGLLWLSAQLEPAKKSDPNNRANSEPAL